MKRGQAKRDVAVQLFMLVAWGCQAKQPPQTVSGTPAAAGTTATARVAASEVVVEPESTSTRAEASVAPSEKHVSSQPPTKATLKQCLDDGWLMMNFPVEDLVDKKHHAICCVKGALLGTDEAFRCSFDWPTNDVPECRLWRHLAAVLKDNSQGKPASALVQRNLAKLEEYAKTAFRCSP